MPARESRTDRAARTRLYDSPMPLRRGEVFAGYTVVRLLGSGGMGEVYLAQHPRLPRRDALKILPADVSADREFRERFNREADLAATLFHPHIVGVHDRGEFDGQLWISMDYVDGTDAAKLVRDHYPAGMPGDEAVKIVTAVASALDYAHQRGVLHRDVKPANILLANPEDGEQRIFLGDFGIARSIGEISGLTATNITLGTVAYAAPEQLLGEDVDGRADQYALAVTAYHLLSGSLPFTHTNPAVVISRHLNVAPPPLARRRPELAGLDPVLAVALAKDPADRFPRCADFARAVAQAGAETAHSRGPSAATEVAPVPESRPGLARNGRDHSDTASPAAQAVRDPARPTRSSRGRKLWPAWAAVAAVIVLGIAAALVWLHKQGHSADSAPPSAVPSQAAGPVGGPPTTASAAALPTPASTTSEAAVRPVFASSPTRLPFTDLNLPQAIAVDSAGNLYVGDWNTQGSRLLKLSPGSTTPVAMPFAGLSNPCAVQVDTKSDVYVLDDCSNAGSRLLKLAAGSSSPIELTATFPAGCKSLAVDSAGNLYFVASNDYGAWALKLAPGSTTPTRLPFTGLQSPTAIAVDAADNVYIAGSPGRVIKLAPGSPNPVTLPFTGLGSQDLQTGVVVDSGGTVYVTDVKFDPHTYAASSRVLALAPDATESTELPFTNQLGQANGIAVDDAGVYVPSDGSTSQQNSGYVLLLRRAG
jgi:serine/threonine-protein kinase